MSKLLTAKVVSFVFYGREEKRIQITVEGEPSYVFRKLEVDGKGTAYLGEDGSLARFFFHVLVTSEALVGRSINFAWLMAASRSSRVPGLLLLPL
jgi:hypothetical protein